MNRACVLLFWVVKLFRVRFVTNNISLHNTQWEIQNKRFGRKYTVFFFPDFLSAGNMVRVIEGKFIWKWSEGKQNLFRVSGRFELLDWASLRMVTRARKSSKASGKKTKKNEMSRGKLGRRRERPLSSFPLGHFALSSPAELSTRLTEEGLLAVYRVIEGPTRVKLQ